MICPPATAVGCRVNMLPWRIIPRLFSYCAAWQMLTATLTCNDFFNCCEWQRFCDCVGLVDQYLESRNGLMQHGSRFLYYSQLLSFGMTKKKVSFYPSTGLVACPPSPFLWLFQLELITSSSLYAPSPVFVISLLSTGCLLVRQPLCA